jgi:hypothetical protein
MKKKIAKKDTSPKYSQFQEEVLYIGHLLKYNLYLLSKSLVLNSLLQTLPKNPDGSVDLLKAVNMTHGVLTAFHNQDHPELAQKAKEQEKTSQEKTIL